MAVTKGLVDYYYHFFTLAYLMCFSLAGTTSGGDSGSDAFDSTQTPTSFGSSDFELVDDTDL